MLQIRTTHIPNFYQAANASADESAASEAIRNQQGAESRPGPDKVSLSPVSRALSHDTTTILKAMTEAPVNQIEKLAAAEAKRRKGFYNTHDVAAKLAEKLISAYPRVKDEEAEAGAITGNGP